MVAKDETSLNCAVARADLHPIHTSVLSPACVEAGGPRLSTHLHRGGSQTWCRSAQLSLGAVTERRSTAH